MTFEPEDSSNTFRLFVLGAGFSCPAGLPLGNELFALIREAATFDMGPDNPLENDLKRYVRYLNANRGRRSSADDVNFEEFLGFLDVEHFLWLEGSGTFSDEGSKSQLIVKTLLARVLDSKTPRDTNIPVLYREFVKGLTGTDMVLTFNYDTLLERALEVENIPYRLFPTRYSKIGLMQNEVTSKTNEVVVLKLHGSVDWFDKSPYLERLELSKKSSMPWDVKHGVFGVGGRVECEPIVDGLRNPGDPLARIFRVREPAEILSGRDWWDTVPFLLNPSVSKLLYAVPLKEFWRGLQQAGALNLSLTFIGYSLPNYDSYARQAFYHLIGNFQGCEPELEMFGRKKTKLRMVTLSRNAREERAFKLNYRFVDWKRTELWTEGFSVPALEWIFRK